MWLIDPRPNQETYQIKFDRSVEGLQSGSTVTLSGVPVGQVTSVRLAENEPENVVVVLTLDPSAAKVHGLEATISTDLITGEAALVLEGRRGRQGIYTDKSGKRSFPPRTKPDYWGGMRPPL
ncbi:MCE family protein [Qipengyuania sp. GPGPB31]|uniref:MlaD family protein n=1 Tax=Qipengyuania sp. GPGPB31 TaxID=3023518 RepID=UPI0031343AA2